MEKKIPVSGLTCRSCEEVINRAVSNFPGATLKGVNFEDNTVDVDAPEEDLEQIKTAIYAKGYAPVRAQSAGHKTTPRDILKGLETGSLKVERKLVEYGICALAATFILGIILSLTVLQGVPNYRQTFAPLVFLSMIAIVVTTTAFAHLSAFRLSHMTGMMVGMTVGMTSGFMLGAISGATNGMFFGSLAGMFSGMLLGSWAGECCGVMGIMEGLMAGLMSGTMGAMLSVMLIGDNVVPFLLVLFAVSIVIMLGLAYAVFKEGGAIAEKDFKLSLPAFIAINLAVSTAFIFFITYGPKSGVFLK